MIRTIHGLVGRVAAETPGRAAIRTRAGSTSYGELVAAADRRAARLHRAGVRAGSVVPIVAPRSPALVVNALAVLKLGAAYAVLDPAWPAERIARLVEVTGAPAVVGPAGVSADLSDDRDGPAVPLPAVAEGDAACVIFTSGSTGTPKGVVSPHRGTTRIFDDCRFATFDRTTVVAWASAMAWDAFNLEVWAPLVTGGTCLLVDDPPLRPDNLRQLVEEGGLNTIWLTASLFNLAVDEDPAAFKGLRVVLTGGERVSPRHFRLFRAQHPEIHLINGYGPVEATVFTTTHEVDEVPDDVPLGRCVRETDIVLLDPDGAGPVGPGEVGEICIAGSGLALGYLGDPELTAAKFVTAEVGGRPTRIYRSGDLGAVGTDGLLRFRGRADRQVKIRGQRVEPGEIEAVVARVEGVTAAVVVAVPSADGTAVERLACFYTTADGGPGPERLRERLAPSLPGYLMPHRFEPVARFPVSANGKIDHRALAAAAASPDAMTAGADEARDPVEAAVAEEFGRILGRPWTDRVRPFRTVSTSLDALRLGIRLARRFDRAVPTALLFGSANVASIAGWLRTPAVAANPVDPVRLPLSPTQSGFWLAHERDRTATTEHCLMIWRYPGAVPPAAWRAAAADLHERHEALRARYVLDGEPVAVVGGPVGEPPVDHLPPSATAEDDLRAVLIRPFDLAQGLVWRAALAPAGRGGTLLGCAVHHVAFDGWSEHVFAADLATALRARLTGVRPHFDRPAAPLATVSARRSAVTARGGSAGFWRSMLDGLPAPLDLPAVAGAGHHVEERRLAAARPIHVYLAALGTAVADVLAARDLVIGLPVAQRADDVLAEAVSCLLDVVPVRIRTPAGAPPVDLHAAAAASVTGALGHLDVAPAEITRAFGARGRAPFDVIAAVAHRPRPGLRLPDGTAEPVATYQRSGREVVAEVWPAADGTVLLALHLPPGADPAVTRRLADAWAAAADVA